MYHLLCALKLLLLRVSTTAPALSTMCMLLPLVFTAYTLQSKDHLSALQTMQQTSVMATCINRSSLLPELWGASAVDNVVHFCAARVEIGLQSEHHIVRHAEALADDGQGVPTALLIYRHAHDRFRLLDCCAFVSHFGPLQATRADMKEKVELR